jgi:hypothetical protein
VDALVGLSINFSVFFGESFSDLDIPPPEDTGLVLEKVYYY